jgi:hypothetical protein
MLACGRGMTSRLHRSLALVAVAFVAVVSGLAAPAVALGDAYDEVFADYQRDGRIDACAHSQRELRQAREQIPNDIDQYAPDFPAALDAAIERRAAARCASDGAAGGAGGATGAPGVPDGGQAGGHGGDGAAGAPGTPGAGGTPGAAGDPAAGAGAGGQGGTPNPGGTANPAPAVADGAIVNAANRTDDEAADAPAVLLMLAVLAVLLALMAFVWAVLRFLAIEPRWLLSARHATAEAGWRAGGSWADFRDWLRTRRTA